MAAESNPPHADPVTPEDVAREDAIDAAFIAFQEPLNAATFEDAIMTKRRRRDEFYTTLTALGRPGKSWSHQEMLARFDRVKDAMRTRRKCPSEMVDEALSWLECRGLANETYDYGILAVQLIRAELDLLRATSRKYDACQERDALPSPEPATPSKPTDRKEER